MRFLFPCRAALVLLASSLCSCYRSAEEKSAAWLKSGKTFLEQKNYPRAVIDFQLAVRESPKNAEANYQLAAALLHAGEPAKALWYFQAAADLEPARADVHLKIAELLGSRGDQDMLALAAGQAGLALKQNPSDPDAMNAMAVVEWRQGKTDAAKARLHKALSIAPHHVESATTLALIQLSEDKDPKAAEQTLRALVSHSSNSARSLAALGRFYLMTGQTEAAERELKQALAGDPQNAQALLELSRLQSGAGRMDEAEQTLLRLSALPDKSFRAAHAMFLMRRGQKQAAIAEWKRYLKEEPKNAELRAQLVNAYLETRNPGEAEPWIQAALAENPNDADAWEQQGRLRLRQRRFADAGQAITKSLQLQPNRASAHYALAELSQARHRIADQRRELAAALKLDPAFVDARLALARALRGQGALKDALSVVDAAPPASTDAAALIGERVWILIGLGRFEEAKPVVERALRASRRPEVLIQAGMLALNEKKIAEGQALLEEALAQDPANVDAVNTLAFSLASKKMEMAVGRVRKQSERAPQSAEMQSLLGAWLEKAGDRQAARAAYAQALNVDSGFTPASIALSRLDMLDGNWQAATSRVRAVLAADPDDVDALLATGMIGEGTGDSVEAVAAYRKVLAIQPGNWAAVNNLAFLLSAHSDTLDEALRLAQQVKRALPENAEVDDTLGWVYYRKGIYRTAITHLERAASRTKDARILYHLSMAYSMAGDKQRASRTLTEAKKLNPSLPEAEEAERLAPASGVPTK